MRTWLGLIALASCLPSSARGDIAGDVRRFTGQPTRLVWAQAGDASDLTAQKAGFHLYGLNTEDGKGIRLLHPEAGAFSKPLLTPDGSAWFTPIARVT